MDKNTISFQIRRERERRGLSQAKLAKRIGTSVATLSRYENGWARFEVYTLRKLASALGCRLEVQFKPIPRRSFKTDRKDVAERLSRLFWDRALEEEDLDRYPKWVIERVLEYGALEDVEALMSTMGRKVFLDWVRRANWQSPRTRVFWSVMLEEEEHKCTPRRSRRQAGNFWTEWKR